MGRVLAPSHPTRPATKGLDGMGMESGLGLWKIAACVFADISYAAMTMHGGRKSVRETETHAPPPKIYAGRKIGLHFSFVVLVVLQQSDPWGTERPFTSQFGKSQLRPQWESRRFRAWGRETLRQRAPSCPKWLQLQFRGVPGVPGTDKVGGNILLKQEGDSSSGNLS